MGNDAWRIFAELCKIVCENENVYLDVMVSTEVIEFMLMPMGEDIEE